MRPLFWLFLPLVLAAPAPASQLPGPTVVTGWMTDVTPGLCACMLAGAVGIWDLYRKRRRGARPCGRPRARR